MSWLALQGMARSVAVLNPPQSRRICSAMPRSIRDSSAPTRQTPRYAAGRGGVRKSAARLAVALALLCLTATPSPLLAQDNGTGLQTLKEALFRGRPDDSRAFKAPPTARFAADDGVVFILDRSQASPLLKFEDSREIWALTSQRAARGDIIYKDDTGRALLRATQTGGLTVFTDERPAGSAAALTGKASPIRVAPPLTPNALLQKLAQASARASRAAQKLITFDAEDVTPQSSALYADSAALAADALVQLAKRAEAKSVFSKMSRVLLLEGTEATVRLRGPDLRITIVPDEGIGGRPSSERILKAVSR